MKILVRFSSFLLGLSLFTEGTEQIISLFYIGAIFFTFIASISLFIYKKKILISEFLKWYLLFLVYSLLNSMIFSINDVNSLEMILRLLVIFVLSFLVYNTVIHFEIGKYIILGFIVAIFLNIFISITNLSLNFEIYFRSRFSGTVGNANILANMILFVIFSILTYTQLNDKIKYTKFYIITIVTSFYLIILTGSRGGLIMAFISVMIVFSKKLKDNIWITTIMFFVVTSLLSLFVALNKSFIINDFGYLYDRILSLINFSKGRLGDGSVEVRYTYAIVAVETFLKNIWTGIGLDNFKLINPIYTHNNYLELAVGVGIIGTILYYYGFYKLVSKYRNVLLPAKYILIALIMTRLIGDMAIVSYYLRTIIIVIVLVESLFDSYLINYNRNENTSHY